VPQPEEPQPEVLQREVLAELQGEQPVGLLPELGVQAVQLVRPELRGLQVQRQPELVLVRLLSALR
jgi:hypothetical protein